MTSQKDENLLLVREMERATQRCKSDVNERYAEDFLFLFLFFFSFSFSFSLFFQNTYLIFFFFVFPIIFSIYSSDEMFPGYTLASIHGEQEEINENRQRRTRRTRRTRRDTLEMTITIERGRWKEKNRKRGLAEDGG